MNRRTEGARPNRRVSITTPQASRVMTAPTWLWMVAPRALPIAPHSATRASPPSVSSRMSPLPSTIVMPRGDACELDGLFVEPDRMRTGVGRRLVEDAKRLRMSAAQCEIDVVANPQGRCVLRGCRIHDSGRDADTFWTGIADVAFRRAMKPRFGDH